MNIFLLFLTTIIMIGYYIMYSPSQNLSNMDDNNVIEMSDLHAMAECVVVTHNDFISGIDEVDEKCAERYGVANADYFCVTEEYSPIDCDSETGVKYAYWVTYSNAIQQEQFGSMLSVIETYYKSAYLFGIFNDDGDDDYVLTVDSVGSHFLETPVNGLSETGQLVYVTKKTITPTPPVPPEPPLPPEPPIPDDNECEVLCKTNLSGYYGKVLKNQCGKDEQCVCFPEDCDTNSNEWAVNCLSEAVKHTSYSPSYVTATCVTSCGETEAEQCAINCKNMTGPNGEPAGYYSGGMLNLEVDAVDQCPCYCIPNNDFNLCGEDGEYVLVPNTEDSVLGTESGYHWECIHSGDEQCKEGYEFIGPRASTGRAVGKTAQKISCKTSSYPCFSRTPFKYKDDSGNCYQWCVPDPLTFSLRGCSDGNISSTATSGVYFGFVTSRTELNWKKQSQPYGIPMLFSDYQHSGNNYVNPEIMEKFFKESTNNESYAQDLKFHGFKCPDNYKEDPQYATFPYSIVCVPDTASHNKEPNNNDDNDDNDDEKPEQVKPSIRG